MSITTTLTGIGKFKKVMAAERERWRRAVLKGVKAQTRATQLETRRHVVRAFNRRIGNTVRSKVYDNKGRRRSASGLVYSKFGGRKGGQFIDYVAPRLFGAVVRPTGGKKFLKFPLTGKGARRGSVLKQARLAREKGQLRFVPIRGGRAALLVKDTKSRSTPLFFLTRQVRYPRRTTRARLLMSAFQGLPREIRRAYRRKGR